MDLSYILCFVLSQHQLVARRVGRGRTASELATMWGVSVEELNALELHSNGEDLAAQSAAPLYWRPILFASTQLSQVDDFGRVPCYAMGSRPGASSSSVSIG